MVFVCLLHSKSTTSANCFILIQNTKTGNYLKLIWHSFKKLLQMPVWRKVGSFTPFNSLLLKWLWTRYFLWRSNKTTNKVNRNLHICSCWHVDCVSHGCQTPCLRFSCFEMWSNPEYIVCYNDIIDGIHKGRFCIRSLCPSRHSQPMQCKKTNNYRHFIFWLFFNESISCS